MRQNILTFGKFQIRKPNNIDIICYTVLLFLVYVMFINKIYPFYVLDDEFGYWSSAAYFSGLDWSSATSRIGYYSYGYSLLLVPFFWIFDNPLFIYRTALVLNAFALTGSFFICLDISERIAPDIRKSSL